MKEVIYKTTTKLQCDCDCVDQSQVILCLPANLVLSGFRFIEATITECTEQCESGFFVHNYTISYNEQLLANPEYNLINSDITGIICQGCLTDWVKDYVESIVHPPLT